MVKISYTTQKISLKTEDSKADVGVNVGVKKLLKIISENPGINAKGLYPLFDVTSRTVERWLKHLRDEKKVEYKGAPKTGGYYIVTNTDSDANV